MTSLLSPLPPSYSTRSPLGGGILLNPSPYRLTPSLPPSSYPSRSNRSGSSSTSSSEDVNTPPSSDHATPPPTLLNSLALHYTSDDDHVQRSRRSSAPEYSTLQSRRIRFAPLPDPRRAVCVTELGEELPLPSVFDEDDSSGIPHPNLHSFRTSPSLLLGDSIVSPKKLPTPAASGSSSRRVHTTRHSASSPPSPNRLHVPLTSSTATVTETVYRTSTSSTRLAKRLFKPFGQKSDDSHRTSSRDSSSSREDTSPSFGIPLGHWASADDASRTTSTNGEPLSRARSANSTAQPKPKRMLNGRMYGARKNNHQSTNMFQNIPDEEPEFVEWGYGGMGSVRSGGMWAKVQSDQKVFLGHDGERGRRAAPEADDEDDGSGMGWVKRRREERERKKREELAAAEATNKTDVVSAPTPVSAPVPVLGAAHDCIVVPANHDKSTVIPVRPEAEDDGESSEEEGEEVDDESSSTEQDDDDGDQVRYLPSSH